MRLRTSNAQLKASSNNMYLLHKKVMENSFYNLNFIGPMCFLSSFEGTLSTPVTTAITETAPFSSLSTLAPQIIFTLGGRIVS